MAIVCGDHVATYVGKGNDTDYTLRFVDEEAGHQHTVLADNLMREVVELGKQLGIDWSDI